MIDAPALEDAGPLAAELARVEVLSQCTMDLRQGTAIEEATVGRLHELNAAVEEGRKDGSAWRFLGASSLRPLELDVLAFAIAPEVWPHVGWLMQQLQVSSPQPYPTASILQEILGLPPLKAASLVAALSDDAPLRRLGLLEADDAGPFAPIRPARGVSSRLLGIKDALVTPPGANRISLKAGWDDLVLPPARVALLKEFLSWIKHRSTVVDAWGGRPVGGPVALFSGPSGTGKTLAASVLATELGWPLYRIDIGALVSKYIGETEKNLNRLFAAAHGRPMILQFDEADSLFGKRSEVKDAHDRYANLEVSHLLSRIEQHDGPCILTTNLRGHIDAAFTRRLQIVVEFPTPDVAARAKLWRLHLPPRAPTVNGIDFDMLGRTVNLTGGGIRNAALHAAYLAAGGRNAIGIEEIALAVFRELGKEGRVPRLAELGPLAAHIREDAPC